MDLWIRSQDKQDLMKPKHIKVVGCCIEVSDFDTCLTFANYKTKERALEVLDEIDEFIDLFNRKGFGNVLSDDGVHSKHTVYEMPKE